MTGVAAGLQVRRGTGRWLRSYGLMLRWHLTDMRLFLPLMVMVQMLTGVGMVLAIGLWLSPVPPVVAVYVATGACVVTLVTLGLVVEPQLVAQQKVEQTYDFLWSLPVPRTTAAAAWITLNLLVGAPAMVAALVAATLRYDLEFAVSLSVVPAVAVTVLTAGLIGYAIAHAVPSPLVMNLISQLLIFVIFGFAPILFPAANLPAWLASLHRWLPFESMATVVRAGLTDGLVAELGRSYLVLGIWSLGSVGLVAASLGRRD